MQSVGKRRPDVMDLVVGKTSEKSLDDVVEKAKDWALLHGFSMRPQGCPTERVELVPFTLLPSAFPRSEYEAALAVQPLVNKLVHQVSRDSDFLSSVLAEAARADEFTRRLLQLHKAVELEEPSARRRLSLGLLRADYMLHDASQTADAGSRLKQVEVNTIASGQGWLGSACSKLHRYVLGELDLLDDNCAARLPENNPLNGLCAGMLQAWKMYGNSSAAVLFIVEDSTQHIADQRFHEYKLRELEPRLRVLRLSLSELAQRGSLRNAATENGFQERRLIVDGEREVGLVYLRSGYSPAQYSGEEEWQARLMIEQSAAVKCPSIAYHLAGSKKVQQVLARPGSLERFLLPEECCLLRRHFAGLYSLDTKAENAAEEESAIEQALDRPDDFVLKPQREGGSNNLFGAELAQKLDSMRRSNERNGWILMDRITPAAQKNYLIGPGRETRLANVNSELGIFGVVLGENENILVNETVGHTLRTKIAEFNEGGVSSGRGACDSPFLV